MEVTVRGAIATEDGREFEEMSEYPNSQLNNEEN